MIKRIIAVLCSVLLLVFSSIPVFALIAVEDDSGSVYYSQEEQVASQKSAWKKNVKQALGRVKNFWKDHGVLTIAVLLIVCILGTVVVLTIEDEKKKKEKIEKHPSKNHQS